ncbi:MAG: preprotein translocase subunit SecG [Woeseia sp.]
MDTMQKVVLAGHTVIALLIILLVLLQRGKGADAGAAFGSGASGTVFGARGSSNFFSRATAVLATVFFASSLTLAYMSSQRAESPDSLIERAPVADRAAGEAPETAERASDLPPLEGSEGTADEAAELPALAPEQDSGDPDREPESSN